MENEKLNGFTAYQLKNQLGISYLAGIKCSAKEIKSYNKGCNNYILYLAPSDLSGYKTCPNDFACKDLCLNRSGHNRMQTMSNGVNKVDGISKIDLSRIKKTKLFFEDREKFMFILINEIKHYREKSIKENRQFAVRLNGTSDLSPQIFKYKGKNILEIFPDVQFYDYTKVYSRMALLSRYSNYDLTLSFNGYNWNECENFLTLGGKVAVVFDGKMPKFYKGFKVNNANDYDMRYLDNNREICGLTYHRVASNYKDGKYIGLGNTKFVVRENDINSIY